jgi:outer membrane lipoprotein-sorting protein
MKKSFLAICLLFSTAAFAQDPTAEAILDKYIAAVGGKEAIEKIKDITISSTSETPRGTSETEIKFKAPDKYFMAAYAMGNEMFSMINNGVKSVRKSSFGGGGGRPEGPEKTPKEVQAEAMMMNPFAEMNYAALELKGTVIGTEKVGDKEAYKVEFVNPEGKKSTTWFDKTTGLKLKTSSINKSPRGEFESSSVFEEYTKFKGTEVMIPKIRKQTSQMGEVTSEVQSVKINKGIDDKVFVIKE